MELLGCPFCRNLSTEDEGRLCIDCGVQLVAVEKLPPSAERRLELEAEQEALPLEYRRLSLLDHRWGRGPLLGLALLGLGLFFWSPWLAISQPEPSELSGFELARFHLPWLWAGAVAWFVMIPLLISRRSIVEMRGVRHITALMAAMSLMGTVALHLLPPQRSLYVPLEYRWAWGTYLASIVAVAGVLMATRLGKVTPQVSARPQPADRVLH